MKKENIFIFTTRIFDNKSKKALFQDCEKIKISDNVFLKKNLYLFNKLHLNIPTKQMLLESIYKDKTLLAQFLENTNENQDIKERILIKLKKNKEVSDILYKDFIEKYSCSKEILPFSLSDIYNNNILLSSRLYINKVKNENIFGYRTLEVDKAGVDVLNTREDFIYSFVADVADYLKEKNATSFFENKNVYLILHEKDIHFPEITDHALTETEIKRYLFENNPRLSDIPVKNLNVIVFQETIGKIINIVKSGKSENIIQQLLDTSIEIIYGATIKKMIFVYEKARIAFAFTGKISSHLFDSKIAELENKLSTIYSKRNKVISINQKINKADTLDKFDDLCKELILEIDLLLN